MRESASVLAEGVERSTLYPALVVGVVLFIAYNATFRHGNTPDTIPTTVMPVSILREGNLDLDEFRPLLSTQTEALKVSFVFGALQERNGHLLSSYPMGTAFLAAPVYALAVSIGYLDSWHHYRVVGKVAASLLTALSAVFLFLSLRSLVAPAHALALTFLYGLGTAAWPIVSQELWQHGAGMLCLSIALYGCTLLERRSSRSAAFVVGGFLALAVTCRLLNALPALALSAFVLVRHRSQALPFFAKRILGPKTIAYMTSDHMGSGHHAGPALPARPGLGVRAGTSRSARKPASRPRRVRPATTTGAAPAAPISGSIRRRTCSSCSPCSRRAIAPRSGRSCATSSTARSRSRATAD